MGDVELNPEEVEDIAWITYDELARELVEQPDKFSSWFQIAAPGVLERLAFSAENRAAFGDIA